MSTETRLTFSQFIAQKRQACGLTQAKVAAAIGIAQGTLSAWEAGYQKPQRSSAYLPKLAEVLNVPLNDLVDAVKRTPTNEYQRQRRNRNAVVDARVIRIVNVLHARFGVARTLDLVRLVAASSELFEEVAEEPKELEKAIQLLAQMVARAGEVPANDIDRYFPKEES